MSIENMSIENMKKIAFCFLVYDTINNEDLWELFFKNVDKNKYTIYIHYKRNRPLLYLEKYKLTNCIATKYGDISLVEAQNVLLTEALKDPNNEHFIFVSNSCIPLKSFDTVYDKLNTEYSYFNLMPQEQCFPRCDSALRYVVEQYIQKASQWCILNKKHANLLVTQTEYMVWFKNVYAADEICYISYLTFSDLHSELIITHNAANDATTFTNWEGMTYKYPSLKSLKNYNSISQQELNYLIKSKCFFGRKFTTFCYSDLKRNKRYRETISGEKNDMLSDNNIYYLYGSGILFALCLMVLNRKKLKNIYEKITG